MLLDMDVMNCQALAVPVAVMQHVVDVESAFNPYAIGVVGARLARQPRTLPEAVATARMLAEGGYNFSLGLAQVNRYNLARYGLSSYQAAFDACANLQAGSRILAECYGRSGQDWGKAFSCYYSGNFTKGFRDGYVQKVFDSMHNSGVAAGDARTQWALVTGDKHSQAQMKPEVSGGKLVQQRMSMTGNGDRSDRLPRGLPVSIESAVDSTSTPVSRGVVVVSPVTNDAASEASTFEERRDTAFVF